MNKSKLINIGIAILLVCFIFLTGFSITGYRQQTKLNYDNVVNHLSNIGQEKHSIIDLDNHEQTVTYITDYLNSKGIKNQDSISSPSYLLQEEYYSEVIYDGTFMTHLLTNILVHIPAQNSSGNAVLVIGHYDSVPMGPGASDDSVAIAVMLEAINYLVTEGNNGINDYIFAFVDGEEYGLYGSEIYMNFFDGFNDVVSRTKFALNLESRGTSGTLIMFETSQNNYQSIVLFNKINSHIFTSSIANMIYQSMPNGTDYSNLKDYYQGINVANLGGGENYHTQNDNLNNVSNSYLTQQMNLVYNLINETKELNLLTLTSNYDAVFFSYIDMVIYYPSFVAIILGVITLLLLGYVIYLYIKRKLLAPKELLKNLALFATILVVSGLTGFIIYYMLNYLAVLFGVIDISTLGSITYLNNTLLVLLVLVVALVSHYLIKLSNRIFSTTNQQLNHIFVGFVALISVILSFILPAVSYLFVFIAIPSLIVKIVNIHYHDNQWLAKINFNWLIFAINIPILVPVIFLAGYALGAGLSYLLAILMALLILPLIDYQKKDLSVIFNSRITKSLKLVSIKFALVLILLLVPMVVAVSSRDNLSSNLTGKQGLSIYPYDDAIVLYQDLDLNQSQLFVSDLNAYPLIKKQLPGLTFDSNQKRYYQELTDNITVLTSTDVVVNQFSVDISYPDQLGYYEIKIINPADDLKATIIYYDLAIAIQLTDLTNVLRFVRGTQITFSQSANELEFEFTEVIIDADLWDLPLFSQVEKIENLKINYHVVKHYTLTK